MTGRKTIPERVREKAQAIHRRHCTEPDCESGPERADWEQATREVMREEQEPGGVGGN